MSLVRSWVALLLLVVGWLTVQYFQSNATSQPTELTGMAMTMPYRIVFGHPLSQEQQQKALATITNTFDEVNSHYNQFNPDSEVSHLNKLQANVWMPLSPQMQAFLFLVDRLVALTEGRFDPTVEPLKKLWMPYLIKGTSPSENEVATIKDLIGWHHIHLSNGQFYKDHDDVLMNFDAVAKGFAVDLLVHNLVKEGFSSILVEWGGEIKTAGRHPEGRLWKVHIQGLEGVELDGTALATSGDYYQKWNVISDGQAVTYSHIFDPRTTKPIEVKDDSITSASVSCSSCAAADAIATALMVFDNIQQAQAWAEEIQQSYPSISFWLAK